MVLTVLSLVSFTTAPIQTLVGAVLGAVVIFLCHRAAAS